jgi:hypothetical protein
MHSQEIRPIYEELQGLMSSVPAGPIVRDESFWIHFHGLIEELEKVTGKDYKRYQVVVDRRYGEPLMMATDYRSKVNALIMRLHGEYFVDETHPFSGSPTTVVNQSSKQEQSQNQSVNISMILDFQSSIDKTLYGNPNLDDMQKSFLEKIKQSLSSVKSFVELINLIVVTAKAVGLNLEIALNLFQH